MKTHHDQPATQNAARSTDMPLWIDTLAHSLIQRAARTAPAHLSDRLEEEWSADLAAQPGALARLRFALGCCWATRVIAFEQVAPAVASAATARGAGTTLMQPLQSPVSRRTGILMLIVLLHALVVYGFASGFAQKIISKPSGPIIGRLITPVRKPDHDIQPLTPNLGEPKWTIPQPTLNVRYPQDDADAIQASGPGPSSVPTSGPMAPIVRHQTGGPGAGFPSSEDFYPPESRRLGESGAAVVEACVDERGRLSSPAVIAQSSGYARLDRGALRLATAGSGHYRSSTEDGRPVSSCYSFRIHFQIQ